MKLKDISDLRNYVNTKAMAVSQGSVIPEIICQKLRNAWGRYINHNSSHFTLVSGTRRDQEAALTHRQVIQCCYATILTEHLLEYKSYYEKYFEKLNLNKNDSENIFNSNVINNIEPHWSSFEELIEQVND